MQHQKSLHHSDPFTDFCQELEKCTCKAICDRHFVLTSQLKRWLLSTSPNYSKSYLELLLPKDQDQPQPSVRGDILIKSEALVLFCILLELKQTRHLESFLRQDILDSRLPIDFPSLQSKLRDAQIDNADALTDSFFAAQWKFRPATFELDEGKSYPPKRILPVIRKELINKKGATAHLWQIEVLEEFVGEGLRNEVRRSKYDTKDGLGPRYNFALKSFHSGKKKQFEQEKKAFANLRQHEGVVKCLANYSHESTHHLLLEYGEMDLEAYFYQRHPPIFEREVWGFWTELFEVAKAIAGIHNVRSSHDGKRYNGWHADIKPDNILLISEKFKLADPGLVKFVQHTNKDPTEFLGGGTWTYSAPEHKPERKEPVTQKIDIWSFACVLSIAATWVIGGYSSIRDFTRIRKRATSAIKNRLPGVPKGDLFHDGRSVLKDVTGWHQLLRGSLRQTDHITGRVFDLVDKCMLLADPEERIDSESLCRELHKILDECPSVQHSPMSSSIRDALLEINEEAGQSSVTTTTSVSTNQKLTDSSGTAEERKNRKTQSLAKPYQMTSHRSEYLNQSLGSSDPQRTGSDTMKEAVKESYENGFTTPSTPKGKSPRLSTTRPRAPTLKRSDTPHEPQNFFQAENELRRRRGERSIIPSRDHKNDTLDRYFNNRDIKFLIDNGSSMAGHWDHAMLLLEVLIRKAVGLDRDGMDASFTCGTVKVQREPKPDKFRKAMENPAVKPRDVETDMEAALGNLFESYLNYLNGYGPKKSLTIIILTDGIWAGTYNKDGIKHKIIDFVKKIRARLGTLRKGPVSLQFIQFGQDPDATYRLQSLDDDLKFEVDNIDVIDTEHAYGDVNKMLLGSFVEKYDMLEHETMSPTKSETSPSISEQLLNGQELQASPR